MKLGRVTLLSPAILLPLLAFHCLAATNPTSSAAGMSTPPAATISTSATTCTHPPRPKKPDPKPDVPQRSVAPSITNVCAPVITIASPSAAASSPDGQTPKQIKPTPSPSNLSSASTAAIKEAIEPPDTFRFKVKDLVEADLSSRSRVLIWVLVGIFAAFGAIVVVGLKAISQPTSKSSSPWRFAMAALLVATAVTYCVVGLLAPKSLNETTIEQLYTARAEWLARTNDDLASTQAIAPQVQSQLATIKDELSEIRRQALVQPAEPLRRPTSDTNGPSWLQIVLFLVTGLVLAYAYSKWRTPIALDVSPPHTTQPTSSMTSADQFMPLTDIYRLEDLLSMVSAITSDSILSGLDKPTLDPAPFLQVLNRVRWQIETGITAEDTPTSMETALRLKDESSYKINSSLKALDEQLSSRYDLPPNEWRKKVLRQLASTRRVILQNCEIPNHQDDDVRRPPRL